MKIQPILRAMTLLAMALALAAGLWGVMPVQVAVAATCTWTGTTDTAWETTGNWSDCQGVYGTAPPIANDSVIIPDVINDPVISTANTTGLNVTIQNGGLLRNNSSGNIAFANFTIANGGKYIHDRAAALPGSPTTRNFGTTSTIEFWRNSTNTCPVFADYGNLIININNFTQSVGCAANLRSIAGNLEINNTSGFELRLVSTQNNAHSIGGNLIVNGGTLVLSNGSGSPVVTVSGGVNISAGVLNMSSSTGAPTLNIGGDFIQTDGTFRSSGSGTTTVAFTGGPSSVTFSTAGGTFTNTNIDWQIAAGKAVGLDTNFGAGSWVNANRTMTVNGAFQINQGAWPGNGGTWNYGPAGTLIYNNNSGSYGVGNDNYWPASNGPVNVNVLGSGGITMNVARTVIGTFQTAAGVINGNNLTLNETVQINTNGYFGTSPIYGSASALVYNSGGSYNIGNEWVGGSTVGSGVPRNVTIQNNTAVAFPTTPGARTVPGNFTISSGSLTLGGNIGDDLNIGGNWTNNGAFNANNRAVVFNGAVEQIIGGSSATVFDYLIINSGATAVIPTDNTPTVSTALTNNGALRQTRNVDTSNTAFLSLGTAYYGVEIDPDSTAMGNTTVTISGNQFCPNASAGVRRCFDITTSSPQAAKVRFYFTEGERNNQALTNLKVWHRSGSAWVLEPGILTPGGSGDAQYVEVTGVDEYSPFLLSENTPTMVDLARFTATPQDKAVLVTWETASELDNVGFNLYRSATAAGPYTQLNDTLIPPQFPGKVMGGDYEWLDTDVQPGIVYFYKLEDLDVKGVSTFHGPVSTSVVTTPTAVGLRSVSARGVTPSLTLGLMMVLGLAIVFSRYRRHVIR